MLGMRGRADTGYKPVLSFGLWSIRDGACGRSSSLCPITGIQSVERGFVPPLFADECCVQSLWMDSHFRGNDDPDDLPSRCTMSARSMSGQFNRSNLRPQPTAFDGGFLGGTPIDWSPTPHQRQNQHTLAAEGAKGDIGSLFGPEACPGLKRASQTVWVGHTNSL